MKPFSLLIKPTSADCNLRCEYCFYIDHLEKGVKTRMSDNVLESMIASYMSTEQPQYVFGWQGGEPTLMGIDFFKRVIELQKKYAPPNALVANGLQTNGTLITNEMAAFFAKYKFLLGVSLDGPSDLHDNYRKTIMGKTTHSRVIEGIENLKRNNVEFNILTLVNNKSVKRTKEIYQYLVKKRFYYHQYIPCVEFDEKGNLLPFSIKGEEWGQFLCDIFDIWYKNDVDRVSIRLFDSILTYLIDNQYILCQMNKDCCQYFVVEYNGDVFPCDFHVREDLKLGNIKSNQGNQWEDYLNSSIYQKFGNKKNIWNEKCNNCIYLRYCHGDCIKHRIGGFNSPDSISSLCDGWKIFYEHALPGLLEVAKRIKIRRQIVSPSFTGKIGRNDPCPCGSGKKFKNCCLIFQNKMKKQ
ncbi:MAG: anaerobic sulfatase maturase [archaeon]|nr:anaerobic sulfatase maturase [archaeon]